MFSNFIRKSCRFWDNVEEYDGDIEAVENDMAACCMLGK